MSISNHIESSPQLPKSLALPFNLMPSKLHSKILVTFLNRFLDDEIKEGDLDFLSDKILLVKVTDAGVHFYLSLKNNHLMAVSKTNNPDIQIQASTYDFLQMAARQQDPDTLVFQRRLIMQGDTELGLELKNFLDGLDFETKSSFAKMDVLIKKVLPVYARVFN